MILLVVGISFITQDSKFAFKRLYEISFEIMSCGPIVAAPDSKTDHGPCGPDFPLVVQLVNNVVISFYLL